MLSKRTWAAIILLGFIGSLAWGRGKSILQHLCLQQYHSRPASHLLDGCRKRNYCYACFRFYRRFKRSPSLPLGT